jgi:predicted porin
MLTSSNLFSSNYGSALKAYNNYIGSSVGLRFAYTQKFDFTRIKGFKTTLAYLNVDNSRFANNQRDYNAIISYTKENFSLQLKGIWVRHDTSISSDGSVTQNDKKNQYRVIANYKF